MDCIKHSELGDDTLATYLLGAMHLDQISWLQCRACEGFTFLPKLPLLAVKEFLLPQGKPSIVIFTKGFGCGLISVLVSSIGMSILRSAEICDDDDGSELRFIALSMELTVISEGKTAWGAVLEQSPSSPSLNLHLHLTIESTILYLPLKTYTQPYPTQPSKLTLAQNIILLHPETPSPCCSSQHRSDEGSLKSKNVKVTRGSDKGWERQEDILDLFFSDDEDDSSKQGRKFSKRVIHEQEGSWERFDAISTAGKKKDTASEEVPPF
ncbi:hypothetical protein Tco_0522505 [Tanacetum coccineum]